MIAANVKSSGRGDAGETPTRLLTPAFPSATELVHLGRIDRSDHRFQLRLVARHDDLIESMRVEGQQCPVVLWGKTSPYKVIDGFRRIEAIAGLGRDSVLALVRSDLDQTQALALSFIENARRHNLTPLDKAHAVWQAVHTWEMGKPLVAKTFGLSVRQIERYLKVLDFEGPLHHAVAAHKITMAHAALLNRACVADLPHWIDEVARKRFSARELRRHLTRNGGQPSRRPYLVRDELGFRLRPLRFRIDMSEAEKERIRQALRTALQIVEQRA